MYDEQKVLRQLKAALRLRTLQCEKAELKWRHALQQLCLIEQLLQTETVRYHRALTQYQQFIGHGVVLNPAMQEQRLLALAAARTAVVTRQRAVDIARKLFQEAKAGLIKAKVADDVTDKALQHVAVEVAHQVQTKELTDIFDAQSRQGGCLGV
ncbi:MAG: hypothetical protein AABY68_05635 [Pseudomonadota bacterium]